jgi:SsrA-binding protein
MKKVIANNKKAYHEYFIEDKLEAGLVLVGTEIKSIRTGSVQFKDAFITIENSEAFIKEMYIGQYKFGNQFNHDETRTRKLLLHRPEIKKLAKQVKLKGYTIVPLSLYLSEGKAKLEIGLALGKANYDKRQVQKERDAKREIEKATKRER